MIKVSILMLINFISSFLPHIYMCTQSSAQLKCRFNSLSSFQASKEMLSMKKKEGDVPSFNFLFELLRGDH